jgi:hypothetical protein
VRGPGGFRKFVVLKRILPSAASDENFIKMFLDEARITAGFSHGGIAQVFDLGEDQQGHFVVLEFIAGRNLNQVVAACADQRAVLPLGFSAAVVKDCALALHYAHTFKKPSGEAYPVIHRDVAQKNVMVTYDGVTKLLDFGIAKASGALARTRAGTVKGTAGYMSPEQVQGDVIDGRSDLFSLGVVLWEMCTGRRLFSAETEIEELQLILHGEITPPHEVEAVVPQELSAVIMKALSRDRAKRFATGRDFAKALDTECAELLYDQDQRAGFMKELFEAEVEATRGLFRVADERASQSEIDQAVQAFAAKKDKPITKERPKISAARKKGPPRRKKTAEVAAEVVEAEAELDEAQIAAAAKAAALAAEPTPPPRSWTMPVLVGLVLLGVGGLSYKVLVHDSGIKGYKGEPVAEEKPTAIGAIPGVDTSVPRPKRDDPPSSDPAPSTTPIAVVQDKEPPRHADPRPDKPVEPKGARGQGEVTLALFPSATVFKGGKELGRGSLINATLPAGTHLLTVVAADGVKHILSVQVQAGKKTPPLRLNVKDIPTQ